MNKIAAIIAVVAFIVIGSMATGIYLLAKLLYPAKNPVHAHEVCSAEDWGAQNGKDRVLFVGPHEDPIWITTNLRATKDDLDEMRDVEQLNKNHNITATIHHFAHGKTKTVLIDELPGPFPLAQPLGDDRYLVATASTFSPVDGYNAFIYDAEGTVVKRLKLGPDINYIQVDEVGHIWVVYDNVKKHSDPINAAGLMCFDADNDVISQYPNKKMHRTKQIRYPQALNVVSKDKLYVCASKGGNILLVKNGMEPETIKRNLDPMSSAMAFGDKNVVFDSYSPLEMRICSGSVNSKANTILDVQKSDGISIEPHQRDFSARGSRLYFTDKKNIYYIDAQELPQINGDNGTSQAD